MNRRDFLKGVPFAVLGAVIAPELLKQKKSVECAARGNLKVDKTTSETKDPRVIFHGFGLQPNMIIVKNDGWNVTHKRSSDEQHQVAIWNYMG